MRKSIDNLKAELNSDVALFHHVDGCYTTLAKAPEGAEVGGVYFTIDGKRLIVKDVIALDAEPRHYRADFLVLDGDVGEKAPSSKAKKPKAKGPVAVDDELVSSMTKEPKQ